MNSPLFTPHRLRGLTLGNRIVIAPMCQYAAQDGNIGDWHLMHLGTLSHSGAGLLIVEATAVAPEGRITPACAGLWCDANESAFARVLQGVRRHSAMPIALQLAHAGRKAACAVPWRRSGALDGDRRAWPTVAPSPLPYAASDPRPAALDAAGLVRIREAFADAARRAHRLGIDALELHSAHGYLLHQFLSPLSNRRDDAYGGVLENRLRFPLEVFEAIRAAWPAEKPLGVRVSATDWVAGGWDVEQTLALARALQARGCDYLHVSSGGLDPQQQIPADGTDFQVPLAQQVRSATGMTTIAVGSITEPRQAERIIVEGSADLVALGRGILYDPRWPWHAAAALGARVQTPPQLWRAPPPHAAGIFQEEDGSR